jgi:hypothetical protein
MAQFSRGECAGLPDSQTIVPTSGGLEAALRRARIMEAAHVEAVLAVRDAELLRLEALRAELAPIVAGNERARGYFDLAVSPGEPPRLWIDLLGSVVMEPDSRTYRLYQDLNAGREILHESQDRAEMVERVKDYMAHRLVARERQMAAATPARASSRGYSGKTLALAWLLGAAAGALALAAGAIILKKFDF